MRRHRRRRSNREHGDCAEVLVICLLPEMEYRNWSGMVM